MAPLPGTPDAWPSTDVRDVEVRGSPVEEPGLSVDPEDLGRQWLSTATEQANFESSLHDLGDEDDLHVIGQDEISGATDDDLELYGDDDERGPREDDLRVLATDEELASAEDDLEVIAAVDEVRRPEVEEDDPGRSPEDQEIAREIRAETRVPPPGSTTRRAR